MEMMMRIKTKVLCMTTPDICDNSMLILRHIKFIVYKEILTRKKYILQDSQKGKHDDLKELYNFDNVVALRLIMKL
jgi:hypothetical protein